MINTVRKFTKQVLYNTCIWKYNAENSAKGPEDSRVAGRIRNKGMKICNPSVSPAASVPHFYGRDAQAGQAPPHFYG